MAICMNCGEIYDGREDFCEECLEEWYPEFYKEDDDADDAEYGS